MKFNTIKKKIDYKSILDSIQKEEKKDSVFDIIELDTIRISFLNNQKANQNKLANILKVTSREIPKVGYYQGMNHIVAFLLIICNVDEEETFYLFLSILFSSDYCSFVDNNLFKLHFIFLLF